MRGVLHEPAGFPVFLTQALNFGISACGFPQSTDHVIDITGVALADHLSHDRSFDVLGRLRLDQRLIAKSNRKQVAHLDLASPSALEQLRGNVLIEKSVLRRLTVGSFNL